MSRLSIPSLLCALLTMSACSVFLDEAAPSTHTPPCEGASCDTDANGGRDTSTRDTNTDTDTENDARSDADAPPPDCATLSDCPATTACAAWSCEQGTCVATSASIDTTCDDGDVCTVDDHCDGDGTCIGSPKVCDDPPADRCDGDVFVQHPALGVCDRFEDGVCVYVPTTTPCSPCESACLGKCTAGFCPGSADGCTEGVCTPGQPPVCTPRTATAGTVCSRTGPTGVATGVCLDGSCVECRAHTDCRTSPNHKCNAEHQCVPCLENRDCGNSSACNTPTCLEDQTCSTYTWEDGATCYRGDVALHCAAGQCVECVDDDECPAERPVCDALCVECTSGHRDACIDGNECTGDVCQGTTCVNPTQTEEGHPCGNGTGTCRSGTCRP